MSTQAPLDLSTCESEPIHIPGTVQSHGVLFALDDPSRVVVAVSENVTAFLGLSAEDVVGQAIEDVVEALREPAGVPPAELSESGRNVYRVTVAETDAPGEFDAAVHFSGGYRVIEIEPVPAPVGSRRWDGGASVTVDGRRVAARMCAAGGVQELCDLMVTELRSVTGYGRAMVYRFGEDGAGEVVAEARSPELEPYLGLHYPASDIPAQARRLYLSQSIRYIADAYAPQAALVPQAMPVSGLRLDLSSAFLRSPSPIHLEYMRNMGVTASVVMSLVKGGALWGLLVAHNAVPLPCPSSTRAICDFLGILGSSLLGGATELELIKAREATLKIQQELAARLSRSNDIARSLTEGEVALGDLVPSDGFAVGRRSGTIRTVGLTPPAKVIRIIARVIEGTAAESVVSSDSMLRTWPSFGTLDLGQTRGVLFVPALEGGDYYLAWFRQEKVLSIKWAGDPNKPAVAEPSGRLRPRNSFALWNEEVRGRSASWTDAEHAAATTVREHLVSAQLRLALARLAKMATYDPLTGLANRRAVDEELERLALDARPAALVYIDLDRFKAVNDDLGHGAGDEFLVAVATRLRSIARADDVVARMGGDEFVVLCKDCSPSAAARVARRIVDAFEAPFVVAGSEIVGTASVGWATANSTKDAADLIRRADTAMYYAKKRGGNQAAPASVTRLQKHGKARPQSGRS